MTTPTVAEPAPPAADPGTPAGGPSATAVWKAVRLPVAAGLVLLVGAIVLGFSGSRYDRGRLDPQGVDPPGSRALAVLLHDRGVRVHRVKGTVAVTAQADPTSTVFLPFPDREPAASLDRLVTLAGSPRLVLVAPSDVALARLTGEVGTRDGVPVKRRDPGCDYPAAATAGDADLGGGRYALADPRAGQRCYGGSLVTAHTRTRQSLVLLGAGQPFTNDRLGQRGNAALALGLLGGADDLWWVLPDPAAAPGPGEQRPLTALLPGWVSPALLQLALAGVLLALWRGRRLGPVVVEPLPVVVRAAESVEGRARLYRRARARDSAADALRAGTRARLLPFLGLGGDPAAAALVEAVSARSGRPPGEVGGLLYGGPPPDDPSLVRLADALDRLARSTLDRGGRP